MKIRKWITFEEEKEFEIDAEDLRTIYLEDEAKTERAVQQLISRAHAVFKMVDPGMLNPEVRKIVADALKVEADRYGLLHDYHGDHIVTCNYSIKPLGSRGCICEVVNRNLLKELARKLGWEEKEGGLTALYFIAEYIGNPSMGLQ
jgi:hypothetical protein